MRWFKFYGQDWLTDMKIRQMITEDKLCFVTLLCLASAADEGGLIRNCSEEQLINLTGLYYNPYDDENEYTRAQGCLKRYEALQTVTLHDNGDVTVNAFSKRQEENLSNAERQKKYRERLKIGKKKSNERYVTQSNDSNARIEERNAGVTENRVPANADLSIKGKKMYEYTPIDEDGNPRRRKSSGKGKEVKARNAELINIGFLFEKLGEQSTGVKPDLTKSYFILKNAKEKCGVEDFEGLFKYFFADPKLTLEQKVSLAFACSPAYITKWKVTQKNKPVSQAGLAHEIRL